MCAIVLERAFIHPPLSPMQATSGKMVTDFHPCRAWVVDQKYSEVEECVCTDGHRHASEMSGQKFSLHFPSSCVAHSTGVTKKRIL